MAEDDYVVHTLAMSIEQLKGELADQAAFAFKIAEDPEHHTWTLTAHGKWVGSIRQTGKTPERICAQILHAAARGFLAGIEFAIEADDLGLEFFRKRGEPN